MRIDSRPAVRIISLLIGGVLAHASLAQAQTKPFEVMHQWTSPGESAAVKVLAEAFNAAGGQWKDSAVAGTGLAHKAVVARLTSGNAPGAALVNFGRRVEELGQEGLLGDISDVAAQGKWAQAVPPVILQSVTVKGKVVAVPVTVAGINWVWFSPQVLKAAGVAPPKTIDEMFTAADRIKAAGLTPFALGTQSWQLNFVYSNLLLGLAGRSTFEQLGRADANALKHPGALKAMELFLRVRGMVDAGATNRSWNDSANLVLTGKAGFQFMGDWAKAEFSGNGRKPGVDFGCMLTPGAQDVYVVMGDSFVMPGGVGADTVAGQKRLASVVMDPAVQRRFALAKGSLPVRSDVPHDGFDACAVQALKVMADPAKVVPSGNMTLTGDVNGAITDTLGRIWAAPAIKPADALTMLAGAINAAK